MSQSVPRLHNLHSRRYHANRYVYPVLSRRSKGISIGVNLNPDKICNFDCIYCQVDRHIPAEVDRVDHPQLLAELDELITLTTSREIFRDEPFREVPEHLRRLNDIAFSGDGEPTSYRHFDRIVGEVAELKERHGLKDTKLVLITNATLLQRAPVRRGLEILDRNQGEIWAKLEAGTEPYYNLVERTAIPFRQVLANIADAARQRPIVIQSLFMRIAGEAPPDAEIDAFCERLNEIVQSGGSIQLVQVYTVARRPAESYVESLPAVDVERIARRVRDRTGLAAEAFPG